jgi:hypothetical protein
MGEKPADLPIQRSAKVQLIINLKAAKALGVKVPPDLSGRADEIIEQTVVCCVALRLRLALNRRPRHG